MQLVHAALIAFSTYSRIPVPQFSWQERDMRWSMCFFPWVGAVIGALTWGWFRLSAAVGIGTLAYVLVACAIPLLVTGGIHADGFMDTCDAFHSYQPREQKLAILKDPHIGAFSVLCLVQYGLVYLAAFSQITESRALRAVCGGFFLARCLSGLSVVSFRSAKSDGMLHEFASTADRRRVKGALAVQLLLCAAYLLWCSPRTGALMLAAAALVFWYYYRRCSRELGGITGDTAGWFLTLCEGAMLAAAAAGCLW